MSDRYTYCVSEASEEVTAQACIVSNHPLTPAEVDQRISIDLPDSYHNGTDYFDEGPGWQESQDHPWYYDMLDGAIHAFDIAVRWTTERSVMEIIVMVFVLGVIIALVRYARSSDLADDVEYYTEEDASDPAYSGGEPEE